MSTLAWGQQVVFLAMLILFRRKDAHIFSILKYFLNDFVYTSTLVSTKVVDALPTQTNTLKNS
jgi:hypothetical protein